MKNERLENFHNYLCDVVLHYQENGTLKNFSVLAEKWKVKAITKEMFYMHDLHKIKYPEQPTREKSDMVRNEMAQMGSCRRNSVRFKIGDVVAWNHGNEDLRSVAVVAEYNQFSVCLNYRGRKDETDRIWYVDNLPKNTIIEYATKEDMKRLIGVLASEMAYKFIKGV